MLLRRFTQHLKDQNWFAVGLDVIVVIVGIFLGMQVTEWNEERLLTKQEVKYLKALDMDLARLNLVFQHQLRLPELPENSPLWQDFKRHLSWRTMIAVADGYFVSTILSRSEKLSERINTWQVFLLHLFKQS